MGQVDLRQGRDDAIFSQIFQSTTQFTIEPRSFIADGKRIAVELVGNARNDQMEALDYESRRGTEVIHSDDRHEGTMAFVEKRKPAFKGR